MNKEIDNILSRNEVNMEIKNHTDEIIEDVNLTEKLRKERLEKTKR